MKIYTKTGDDGSTGLLGNVRVRKDAMRIEAYGSVDEVNAALGLFHAHVPPAAQKSRGWLDAIQSDLFVIGTLLASSPESVAPKVTLEASRIQALEEQIDQMESELRPLTHFILPQGAPVAAFAHLARAISRRAERRVVTLAAKEKVDSLVLIYLNRLSDFLFVLARWVNAKEGGPETAWIPREGSSPTTVTQEVPKADLLSQTLRKLEDEKNARKTLFEKASSDLQKKKENAAKAFHEGVDQIKKEGGTVQPPIREIDLD
jgi:cob(I)alamin adenosyltransferase